MWIIDTNIIVSTLISKKPDSPPRRIVQKMLKAEIVFWLSNQLIEEYRHVLQRSSIRKLHNLTDTELENILTVLILNARWCEPPNENYHAPDRGDNHLWALLNFIPNTVLVTGDKLLQNNPPLSTRIISPSDFPDLFV
ncbi:MAG: putative toxin-antitoxin system toxin component, PIN family [Thiotrichaceae bacterium]